MRVAVGAVLFFAVAASISQPLSADDAAKAQKLIDRAIVALGGNEALEKSRNRIIEDGGTYYGMGDGVTYKGRYVYRLEHAETLLASECCSRNRLRRFAQNVGKRRASWR